MDDLVNGDLMFTLTYGGIDVTFSLDWTSASGGAVVKRVNNYIYDVDLSNLK